MIQTTFDKIFTHPLRESINCGMIEITICRRGLHRSEKLPIKGISMRLLLIFSLALLVLICGDVFQVFSEAPATPKILFSSSQDGNWEVYMMNPDGSEQVNLTQHPADDRGAAWSPTGEQILFASDRRRKHVLDLYLMDADGANVRRVFKKKVDGSEN